MQEKLKNTTRLLNDLSKDFCSQQSSSESIVEVESCFEGNSFKCPSRERSDYDTLPTGYGGRTVYRIYR